MTDNSFYKYIKAMRNFATDEDAEKAGNNVDGAIYYNTNIQAFKQYQGQLLAWTVLEDVH